MRILAIDVGSGTQDIVLFDPEQPIENAPKLVMPSPTRIAAGRVRAATRDRRPVVFTGVTAGGGHCHWALGEHIQAGFAAYATAEAAGTFDDDLERLAADGLRIVSKAEARGIDGVEIVLGDINLDAIDAALGAFDVEPALDGVAVAVLDHGVPPTDMSDRIFRFQQMEQALARDREVVTFAYAREDIPPAFRRARAASEAAAAAGSTEQELPVVFMDAGPSAALGAVHDAAVARTARRCIVNVGNMHTLGFILTDTRVDAIFEHHTGELTADELAAMVTRFIEGTLTNEEVYSTSGHGLRYLEQPPFAPEIVSVTGPQRDALLLRLPDAHAAAPFGDMMLTGCFGLLAGFAHRVPAARATADGLLQR